MHSKITGKMKLHVPTWLTSPFRCFKGKGKYKIPKRIFMISLLPKNFGPMFLFFPSKWRAPTPNQKHKPLSKRHLRTSFPVKFNWSPSPIINLSFKYTEYIHSVPSPSHPLSKLPYLSWITKLTYSFLLRPPSNTFATMQLYYLNTIWYNQIQSFSYFISFKQPVLNSLVSFLNILPAIHWFIQQIWVPTKRLIQNGQRSWSHKVYNLVTEVTPNKSTNKSHSNQ